MISYEVYTLLKKGIEAKVFTDYEETKARRCCSQYEEYQKELSAKREAHNQEMKQLMLDVLTEAEKPLCPTEMQFILYRKTGNEYSCGTIAWYCGALCWFDKKLTSKTKRSRTYYSIREN